MKRPFMLRAGIMTAFCAWLAWPLDLIADSPTLSGTLPRHELKRSAEPVLPIPRHIDVDQRKVALGLRLFEDKRLSRDGSMACRTCHLLDKGGGDGRALSPTINGGRRSTNTPTLFNVGLNTLYGWLGAPTTLEALTEAIIKSKKGLDSDWATIIPRLDNDDDYIGQFNDVYADGIQPANVNDAIAEYMRSLITPGSRFDRFLQGDAVALSNDEIQGYDLFKKYGCSSCHQGELLGGNMTASKNIFVDANDKEAGALSADIKRYEQTDPEPEHGVLRVPTLRNVQRSGPYFHDGSVETLDEAVELMGRSMLGRDIPPAHIKQIVRFLNTLTGKYKGQAL